MRTTAAASLRSQASATAATAQCEPRRSHPHLMYTVAMPPFPETALPRHSSRYRTHDIHIDFLPHPPHLEFEFQLSVSTLRLAGVP